MPFHFAEITPESLGTEGFLSWAYLDRRDGTIVGSENMSAPTDTASMIKAWLGADYLRRAAEQGDTPPEADLADIQAMIRTVTTRPPIASWRRSAVPATSVGRLLTMCQLSDSAADAADWRNDRDLGPGRRPHGWLPRRRSGCRRPVDPVDHGRDAPGAGRG